jgi:predicted secreted protein
MLVNMTGMRTHLFRKYGILWLLLITMACNVNRSNSTTTDSGINDTIVFTGCQEKITLKAGSVFEIKLEAVKGTGYQWLLKEPCQFLQLIENDVIRYSSDEENKPGQKSYQVLQFKALKKGEGIIQLEYKRTFEKGIEKTCSIKIVIN